MSPLQSAVSEQTAAPALSAKQTHSLGEQSAPKWPGPVPCRTLDAMSEHQRGRSWQTGQRSSHSVVSWTSIHQVTLEIQRLTGHLPYPHPISSEMRGGHLNCQQDSVIKNCGAVYNGLMDSSLERELSVLHGEIRKCLDKAIFELILRNNQVLAFQSCGGDSVWWTDMHRHATTSPWHWVWRRCSANDSNNNVNITAWV